MEKRLVIDVQPKIVAMALLEDNRLVEFQKEKQDSGLGVGDIILGKVKKIIPGLNAAFVNVGTDKEAFLHYSGLGRYYGITPFILEEIKRTGKVPNLSEVSVDKNKEIPKNGSIADFLKEGQRILVQISKESISTKGPSVSTDISIAGHFLVLNPLLDEKSSSKRISISQKIKSKEERRRLIKIMQEILPEGVSVVLRTSSQGKTEEEIRDEFEKVYSKWQKVLSKIEKTSQAPSIIYKEGSRIEISLRDSFNESYSEIAVNDSTFYDQIKEYVTSIFPEKANIVKLYTRERPIFDHYGITRQRKVLLGKSVTYKGGAYLVIEQTEAMHVIDVNSGGRSRRSKEQEETALDVNLSAAEEVARQMRLRDLGGIIVVDFIDMNDSAHRTELYNYMKELLKNDRASHKVLPLSKFGVMQITRQRIRQSVSDKVEELCPSCQGRGKIQPALFFTDDIEKKIDYLVNNQGYKPFSLHIHPYLAAYLQRKESFFSSSIFSKWKKYYGNRKMKLIEDENMAMLEYRFYDDVGEEIDFSKA